MGGTSLDIVEHLHLGGDARTWAYKSGWINEVESALVDSGATFRGSHTLEIGAGVHNPLGAGLVALSRGAARASAIEPGSIAPTHLYEAAMVGLLGLVHADGEHEALRSSVNLILESLRTSSGHNESKELCFANLAFQHTDIDGYHHDGHDFDVVHSNAVIEHIMDYEKSFQRLSDLTKPGGLHVHKIDFIDHRYYENQSPSPVDAIRFMLAGDTGSKQDFNRLRLSEVIHQFRRAGLELVSVNKIWRIFFDEVWRSDLDSRYAEMSRDDLSVTCAVIVLQKSL